VRAGAYISVCLGGKGVLDVQGKERGLTYYRSHAQVFKTWLNRIIVVTFPGQLWRY
jgi:hypothetical protein